MDGREGMTLQGSTPYYLNRGTSGPGGSGTGPNAHNTGVGGPSATAQAGGMHTLIFKPHSNPNITVQQNLGISGGGAVSNSPFHVENPSPSFPHGTSMTMVPGTSQGGETVKKKRGRPRKYGPDGANMSLGLSPMSATRPSSGEITPGEKGRRGRPPGSGWKQKLAPLGEWMNSSAGLAFTPHVLHVGVGEDVAAKVLAFAQQRPRALCILSGNGTVSAVTLRQPTTSGGTVTYEGRFEILCLSGSYLVADDGGPNRTGGISISVCSPDGHMIGGAIGGRLIAANLVQVVACSFVYGTTTKGKSISESEPKEEKCLLDQSAERSSTPVIATPVQMVTPNSRTIAWQSSGSRLDSKDSGIDLTRG